MGKLLLIMIIVPLVDLFILLRIASIISFWPTVALVVITGIIGHQMLKRQGLHILASIQNDLREGKMPADRIFSGVLLLIGGVLLITPGFMTDCFGFILLIPGNRRIFLHLIKNKFIQMQSSGRFHMYTHNPNRSHTNDDEPPTINI